MKNLLILLFLSLLLSCADDGPEKQADPTLDPDYTGEVKLNLKGTSVYEGDFTFQDRPVAAYTIGVMSSLIGNFRDGMSGTEIYLSARNKEEEAHLMYLTLQIQDLDLKPGVYPIQNYINGGNIDEGFFGHFEQYHEYKNIGDPGDLVGDDVIFFTRGGTVTVKKVNEKWMEVSVAIDLYSTVNEDYHVPQEFQYATLTGEFTAISIAGENQ